LVDFPVIRDRETGITPHPVHRGSTRFRADERLNEGGGKGKKAKRRWPVRASSASQGGDDSGEMQVQPLLQVFGKAGTNIEDDADWLTIR